MQFGAARVDARRLIIRKAYPCPRLEDMFHAVRVSVIVFWSGRHRSAREESPLAVSCFRDHDEKSETSGKRVSHCRGTGGAR